MRKLASIQTVNAVEPIPNADAIEKIRVLGWWVVVKKGEHRVGDKVVYCEIDSLLPERPPFEFLRASSFKPARIDAATSIIGPIFFSCTSCLRKSSSVNSAGGVGCSTVSAADNAGPTGKWETAAAGNQTSNPQWGQAASPLGLDGDNRNRRRQTGRRFG
jgi:hypothetical protein